MWSARLRISHRTRPFPAHSVPRKVDWPIPNSTSGTGDSYFGGTIGQYAMQYAHGYDFHWVLNDPNKFRLDAVAQDTNTGITLWQSTAQPGVQVDTGNYLRGDLPGAAGDTYRSGDAFTLETQHYPDSPNHQNQAGWPSVVLGPGQTFTLTPPIGSASSPPTSTRR